MAHGRTAGLLLGRQILRDALRQCRAGDGEDKGEHDERTEGGTHALPTIVVLTCRPVKLEGQVDRELTHSQLDGMCETIVRAQVNQILDMRHMMCKRFGVCDFQPTDTQ